LKGGGEKVIPAYVEPKNNPYIPTEQKQIYAERMSENVRPEKPPQNPVLNLQLYQPPRPKQEPNQVNPIMFMPNLAPNPMFPPQYGMTFMHPPFAYATQSFPTMPIVKNYNISTSGPTSNHSLLNLIYEDVLPSKTVSTTSETLSDRLAQLNFIRTVMFSEGDGSDINIDGTQPNSLLSRIKFMELNPYNPNKLSDNPYKGLPNGYLIYRSCYPIRHNQTDSNVICARNSMGANVKIYKLTEGAYLLSKQNKSIKIPFYEYDQWREIAYYEYIREHIIKQKICPNFVNMYGYYISINSGIDFMKVAEIRNGEKQKIYDIKIREQKEETKPIEFTLDNYLRSFSNINVNFINKEEKQTLEITKDNMIKSMNELTGKFNNYPKENKDKIELGKQNVYKNILNLMENINLYRNDKQKLEEHKGKYMISVNELIELSSKISKESIDQEKGKILISMTNLIDLINSLSNVTEEDIDKYTGKALIAVTEAPNYNITTWGSIIYQVEGNIKRMVNTGNHDVNCWLSVLFQLMIGLYVMQINGIYINNFNMTENVFIKDLTLSGDVTNFWKYSVDNIDYFIPNFGYLTMIDSNYKDINDSSSTRFISPECNKIQKLNGKIFGKGNTIADTEIKQKTFEMFKTVFNSDNFGKSFTNDGGVKPPQEIIKLLSDITKKVNINTDNDIGNYIFEFMRVFTNNRVGTYLKEQELTNIRPNDTREFKKGDILVHEVGNGTHKFVLYIGVENSNAKILTKGEPTDTDIIESIVPIVSLKNYNKAEPIVQNFKIGEGNLNDDYLLETYVIMKP